MLAGSLAGAQELPRGRIVDEVQCLSDPAQRYSLYLPSTFSPENRWPVILGFDAGGRGRRAVERYLAAAERYGYIVAGSNNSRNGPWEPSLAAAAAMAADVEKRFPIDPRRKYTAGMSGGARVAMKVALESGDIAGVLASSAGFPDDLHETVSFPIFGTAGTDDFNHWEMQVLDRRVKTPHRVEVFEGGHVWPPVELATNGVEWMEIQAMRRGLRPRDRKRIDGILATRLARANAQTRTVDRMRELRAIAADFDGLADVAAIGRSAAALETGPDVREAIAAERAEEDRELDTIVEVYRLRDALTLTNSDVFARFEARVLQLWETSKGASDSPDRRIARRVLTGLNASSRGIYHPGLQDLLSRIRPPETPQ
jgi:hypothetical protein